MLEGSPPTPPPIPKRPTPPALPGARPALPRKLDVAPAPKNVASPSRPTEALVIRTMQDDLREARGEKTPSSAARPRSQTTDGKPTTAPSEKAPMPLPPKAQKVVMAPLARRRRSRLVPTLLVLLLAVVVIGAGGFAWWTFNQDTSSTGGESVGAADVLPASSAVILRYSFATTEAREQLLSAWNTAREETPSVASLVTGDPRLLLQEPSVDTAYYVLLEDEVRPYLVVPHSARTEELLTNNPDTQVHEVGGWYIASAVSTDSYTLALSKGGWTEPASTTAALPPLDIYLGPHALLSLRENLLGTTLANGLLQELSLATQFTGATPALTLSGHTTTLEPLFAAGTSPTGANQQLLSLVPEDASFVHLGSNFYDDLTLWTPTSGAVDRAVLEELSVASLLQQFTGSYVLYSVSSNPSAHDLGLIISIPMALQGQIVTGNATVEQALSALLPHLTGRKGVGRLEFSNNTHAGVPLRYANFSQPSQALDYAVVDREHLVVTTSRESMFALLETATGLQQPLNTSLTWRSVLNAWGALPNAPHLVFGTLAVPQLTKLLPAAADRTTAFGLAIEAAADSATDGSISGVMVLP